MFELLQSIFTIFLITVSCYFPKKYYLNLVKSNNSEKNLIELLSLGSVIHIFSLLILSFLTLLSQKILIFYFIILFLHNLFFIIKDKIFTSNIKFEIIYLYFIILILVIYFLNNFYIGWDAQNYWITKALTIYNDNSIENLKYTTRPEYPHLGSFIWAVYMKISFINNELYGRIFYIYFFCLTLFSISSILSKNKTHNLIFFSFLILICFKETLFNGYQEILIFSLFILITKEFYLFLENKNDKKNFSIIILSCISMSWIKSEGMIFALLLLFIYFLANKSLLKNQLIIFFVVTLIIITRFAYLNFIEINSSFQSGNYELFSMSNIINYITFDRVFLIFKYFMFGTLQNLIFLLSILSSIFIIINTNTVKLIKYQLFYFLFCIIFIFCAYLFTNLPLEFHLKYSIDRLFFQVSGFFIIFLIIVYKKLYK